MPDRPTRRHRPLTKAGRLLAYRAPPLEPGWPPGIEFDEEGNLFVVDMLEDRILRIAAPTPADADSDSDDDDRLDAPE